MKKVILSFMALAFCFGAFAQDSTMQKHHMPNHKMGVKTNEGIMMKDGKVMVIEDGKSTELTQDKTLSNGTVISTDGTVKKSDGTTATLKDGDWVSHNGTITHRNWKKKGSMSKSSSDSLK